ncbi:1-phosphofructokinase [Fusibacter paucivorans]|uniref:Tagatose-6-phosphate kinase n=1 Tax=Fusibacter paucivorans TaxID=76009 RepID=A0ABS5PM22_9FIRM|nr:1-phosphofructokinase [Fusibacter paucivorans]MBS7525454.1 1-phosphofructokinase [Fusibacter paucivorans]
MILTVTLNPAIDRTIIIDNFRVDQVNRVQRIRRDIGGKGLNVTKTINAMGGSSKALLVLGGENGKFIKERANADGLNIAVFEIEGNTRENIKLVDPVDHTFTDVNEPGPALNRETCQLLAKTITQAVKQRDWLVISGSSPKGIDTAFYETIFSHAEAIGVKIIADVSGKQLETLLQYKPWLIKPNIHELGELFDVEIEDSVSAIAYARQIIKRGISTVVVSMGEKGLLWVDAERAIVANAVKVPVKSTVGAGDAIVAGLTLGLSRGEAPETIIREAIAAATCVITTEGSMTGDLAKMPDYQKRVIVQKL